MVDVDKAVTRIRYWCDEANLGYSQPGRWNIRVGGTTDCSAITAHVYNEAGITPKFPSSTWTGSWRAEARARGFSEERWDWHDENDLKPGDLLLSETASGGVGHIAMYVGGSQVSEAWINEEGDILGGQDGDQTDNETRTVSYWSHPYSSGRKWTHVLYPPRGVSNMTAFRSAGGAQSVGSLESEMLTGIDVSNHQPGFNPAAVAADFIIVLATEGSGFTSPTFAAQYDGARAAGKLVGAYHFARNSWNTPEEEAEYFLRAYGNRVGTGVIVLDWEDRTTDVAWAHQWLRIIHQRTGIKPLIYMSASRTVESDWSSVANDGYKLWVAHYTGEHNVLGHHKYTRAVGSWGAPLIWQFTETGQVAGYNGNLDLNVGYLTRTQWQELATGKTITPHAPVIRQVGGKKLLLVHCFFNTGVRYAFVDPAFLEFSGEAFASEALAQLQGRSQKSVEVTPTFWNEHIKKAAIQGTNLDINYGLTEKAVLDSLLRAQEQTNQLLTRLLNK